MDDIHHNDETSEEDEGEKNVDYNANRTLNQGEEKVRSAPYVKQQQASGSVEDIPVNSSPKEIRRDRHFSFLYQISTSETDTEPKSAGVDDLDWLEDSKEDSSQGFGGSEHLSYGMTDVSNSDQMPEDSPSISSSHVNYKTALNRPLTELFLAPQMDFTPPTATPPLLKPDTVETPLSGQSTASNRAQAELSWDNNDMAMIHRTPDAGTGGAGRPCLKTLTLESP